MRSENQEYLFGLDEICERVYTYCKIILDSDDKEKQKMNKLSISPTFLFYGLPGTGKTALAHKIYCRLKLDYNIDEKHLKMDSLISSNFGESSQNLLSFFEDLKEEHKKNQSKSFIIIDEIDSFTLNRFKNDNESIRRVLLTFNTIFDELRFNQDSCNFIVVATTNLMEEIDTSVLRRFFFKEDFIVILDEQNFHTYMDVLLGEIQVRLDNEEYNKLYKLYEKKKFTLGEIKKCFANIYMKMQMDDKNKVDLCKTFSEQSTYYELLQKQINMKGN